MLHAKSIPQLKITTSQKSSTQPQQQTTAPQTNIVSHSQSVSLPQSNNISSSTDIVSSRDYATRSNQFILKQTSSQHPNLMPTRQTHQTYSHSRTYQPPKRLSRDPPRNTKRHLLCTDHPHIQHRAPSLQEGTKRRPNIFEHVYPPILGNPEVLVRRHHVPDALSLIEFIHVELCRIMNHKAIIQTYSDNDYILQKLQSLNHGSHSIFREKSQTPQRL
jgi:hypothetical protein